MKRVIVTPMDWGLGHAARCVPIIRELLKWDCTVFIAGSGDSLLLLKKEFPQLAFFTLPAYRPAYSKTRSLTWKMLIQIPKFINVIRKEHQQIDTIIRGYKIDVVISDNRYGCWSARIPSVIITHQLKILMPKGLGWIEPFINKINHRLIRRFSACWIPDYDEATLSLSGKLSEHSDDVTPPVAYIGPLSRFRQIDNVKNKYDLVCIISGPEPQRKIFEQKVRAQLQGSGIRYLMVRGLYSGADPSSENEVPFLNSDDLEAVISQSSLVVARSGYSTIMDLAALGKKGVLVPTPGQTEQEYLAERWKEKGVFYSMSQHDFSFQSAVEQSKSYTGFSIDRDRATKLLDNALETLLNGQVKSGLLPNGIS